MKRALTPKQLQVLDLMVQGNTNKEIARVLIVAEPTVKHHVSSIIDRLTARNRQNACYLAVKSGLTKIETTPEAPIVVQPLLVVEKPTPWLRCGEVEFCEATKQIKLNDKPIKVRTREFQLLKYLLERPFRVHSRQTLLDSVWGTNVFLEERVVDVYVLRVRRLLKAHGVSRFTINTERGLGYRLVDMQRAAE